MTEQEAIKKATKLSLDKKHTVFVYQDTTIPYTYDYDYILDTDYYWGSGQWIPEEDVIAEVFEDDVLFY